MNALDTIIVLDSSADTAAAKTLPRALVPLKIITSEKEYIDNSSLDVGAMIADLRAYSGKSSTSCPNPQEFLAAFGEAKYVFCITITGGLSGSHNAALAAAHQYPEKHPERRACVYDSLSTGPEMALLIERMQAGIRAEKSFDEIEADVRAYAKHTHLLFALESMKNLARNGRVKPLVAKLAGVLDIRIVGVRYAFQRAHVGGRVGYDLDFHKILLCWNRFHYTTKRTCWSIPFDVVFNTIFDNVTKSPVTFVTGLFFKRSYSASRTTKT